MTSCSDAVFYYSATLSDGSALPSCITLSTTSLQFDWSAATTADVGSYNILLTGYLNNGQSLPASYTLNILQNCDYAVITASTFQSNYQMYVNEPKSISFSDFTSTSTTDDCGAMQYIVTGSLQIYSINGTMITLNTNDYSLVRTTPYTFQVTGY